MVWAAYAFVMAQLHMEHVIVPQPVVIAREAEGIYTYNIYEDAIYVPMDWKDDCEDQKMIVYEMATHFNNFKQVYKTNRLDEKKLQAIKEKWVCLSDRELQQ